MTARPALTRRIAGRDGRCFPRFPVNLPALLIGLGFAFILLGCSAITGIEKIGGKFYIHINKVKYPFDEIGYFRYHDCDGHDVMKEEVKNELPLSGGHRLYATTAKAVIAFVMYRKTDITYRNQTYGVTYGVQHYSRDMKQVRFQTKPGQIAEISCYQSGNAWNTEVRYSPMTESYLR